MSDNDQAILVEVLQGTQISGGCDCSGGCPSAGSCSGNTGNIQEMTANMAHELQITYGEKVAVKYVNVDESGLDNYPIMNRVLQMGYPYPVTLVNGEPKFAGGLMLAELKQIIDELLKTVSN